MPESVITVELNAHFLAHRSVLILSQNNPVPSTSTKPLLYMLLVCEWVHLFASPMPRLVAVEAGSDDVLPTVAAAIFPGMQMLGSALEFSDLRFF